MYEVCWALQKDEIRTRGISNANLNKKIVWLTKLQRTPIAFVGAVLDAAFWAGVIHKYIIKFYLLLIRHFKSIKYFAKVLPMPEPIIGKYFIHTPL